MKANFFCALILAGVGLTVKVDEKLPMLKAGSQVFSNITVTSVSATDVFFSRTPAAWAT
jgi:hypothetical protein